METIILDPFIICIFVFVCGVMTGWTAHGLEYPPPSLFWEELRLDEETDEPA